MNPSEINKIPDKVKATLTSMDLRWVEPVIVHAENNQASLAFEVDGKPLIIMIRIDGSIEIAQQELAAALRTIPRYESIRISGEEAYLIRSRPAPDCGIVLRTGNVFAHVTAGSEELARDLALELMKMLRGD